MKYFETTIKVEIKEDGTDIVEVMADVQGQAQRIAKYIRSVYKVGNAHAWSTRHEQVAP